MVSYDDYVIDVLLRDVVGHDHSPAAFIVFLFLWRESAGRKRKSASLSHQQMSDATGLSKSAVQGAIRHLLRRKLISQSRDSVTATPVYEVLRHWTD